MNVTFEKTALSWRQVIRDAAGQLRPHDPSMADILLSIVDKIEYEIDDAFEAGFSEGAYA